MRFLVCIKQVVDTSNVDVDPETGLLKREGVKSILNPCDRHALEAAFVLREQTGGTVTVITMGPPQAEEVLLEAVSMGADDIYLVTDRAFGGADTLATSYTLAAAVRKLGPFDLIFCGQASSDSTSAQVGPQLASALGMDGVSGAVKISLLEEASKVEVTRELEEEKEVLQVSLPVVVTVAPEMNSPRYPSVTGIQKKWNTKAVPLTSEDLDVEASRIGLTGSPTRVARLRSLKKVKKENLRIEGKSPEEASQLLAEALVKIRVI